MCENSHEHQGSSFSQLSSRVEEFQSTRLMDPQKFSSTYLESQRGTHSTPSPPFVEVINDQTYSASELEEAIVISRWPLTMFGLGAINVLVC